MNHSLTKSLIIGLVLLVLMFSALGIGSVKAAPATHPAYVRSTVGSPWDTTTNEQAMDTVFGAGNWADLRYETVNPAVLFSPTYDFIFLEGSDDNATEMEAFINANRTAMEAWVSAGGRLFLNAGPNEDNGMLYGFGGVQLIYNDPISHSGTGVAVNPAHAIFNGPFTPAGTNFTGTGFSHASVSGGGITPVMTGQSSTVPLAEEVWGNGCVMFGGMTATDWHNPQPNATNLRANILSYLRNCAPEMAVLGNGVTIPDDDTTPTPADHTDFGGLVLGQALTRTFTISNSGGLNLNISSLSLGGTAAADFSISGIVTPATVISNSTTTFDVRFDPSVAGTRVATITIANNDSNENPYGFAIQGRGIIPLCFTEYTGDNTTDFASEDAQAVRDAVAAAPTGGTVKIAGYCAGVQASGGATQTVRLVQPLTLAGGYTSTNWTTSDALANPTTLDALGGGRVIFANAALTVRDLTVQNGRWSVSNENGGGIFTTQAITLTGVTVYSNTVTNAGGSGGGGGLFASGPMILTNGVFRQNSSNAFGGGFMSWSTLTLSSTQVFSNTSGNSGAGGLAVGSAAFTGGLFQGNVSTGGGSGGFYALNGVTLTGTAFINNRGLRGGAGALYLQNGNSRVVNALFAGNSASNSGSAMQIPTAGLVEIIHTTIVSPTLGGTAAINVSAGTTFITNTIISNYPLGIERTGGSVSEDYNLFFGNTANLSGAITSGSHSFTGNPAFANPVGGDYHLTTASLAVDAGVNLGVTTDFEGESRPQGGGFDLGYDESSFTAREMAVLGNGVEIAAGDAAPSLTDHTDFGSVTLGGAITRTFTISNSGMADLTLSSLNLSGAAATDFTLSGLTTPAAVGPNTTATFNVRFTPSVTSTRAATVTIANNDSDENSYDFAIQGTGTAAATGSDIYLPFIFNGFTPGPDLVVDNVTAGPGGPRVTIRNAGNTAVTDAFWVDVYFNPNPAPPPLNRTWQSIAPYGAHWGVTQSLAPGQSLTLTIGGPYYAGGSASFPAGAQVYAYVDSINYATPYGNVQESNETNNVFGPVVSTASESLPTTTTAASTPAGLPER